MPIQQEEVVQVPVVVPQKRIVQQSVEQTVEVPVSAAGPDVLGAAARRSMCLHVTPAIWSLPQHVRELSLYNGLSLFLRFQRSFEGSPYSNTQPRVTFLRQSTALEARFI